jgi:NADPH:quinone reductase-like Zn-dependent oxidoreductase
MRAAVFHRYGGPEVVAIEEIPRPVPGPRDVLVRISAQV